MAILKQTQNRAVGTEGQIKIFFLDDMVAVA